MSDMDSPIVYISGPAEWIAKRRELLAAATEGPWYDMDGIDWEARVGGGGLEVADTGKVPDARLIADARTSLPRALDALEAALKGHRPVSFSFSWRDGVTMHEVCDTCHDKAGVHPCGCWRDEDVSHLCAVCSDPEHRMEAPWPCMTVQAIEAALRGES